MKKVIPVVKYLLWIILVVGIAVAGYIIVRNKSLPSSKLTSNEVAVLNDKINSIPPEDTSEKRIDLLKQIDNFTKKSVVLNGFSPDIYSLVKIRLDQALKEIPNAQVPKGHVKIWYIYNMGVIAKSADKTIAFDLAGDFAYSNLADFTKYIDILVISHIHGDHFSMPVVKEALKNGVTVIIPGDKVVFKDVDFVRDPKGEDAVSLIKKRNGITSDNFISLKPQEKTIIKGVEITAYPTDHIHNYDDASFVDTPVNWYYVNLDGFTILHTGDGAWFNYQPDFTNKDIDLFILHAPNIDPMTNNTLVRLAPNAKTILPLHVLELGHGPSILDPKNDWYMSYQSILDNYANGFYRTLQGKSRFIPMVWGEGLSF